MRHIPSDFVIGGIYLPPLLVASGLGLVAAALTAALLNRTHLTRYFFYPPLVVVSLALLYTGFIALLFLGM